MANDAYDPGPNGDYPHWRTCTTCGLFIGFPVHYWKGVLIGFSYPVDRSQVCEDLTHEGR